MRYLAFSLLLALLPGLGVASEVRTQAVSGHVSMLSGKGGNVGVSAGQDGVFLVDDQYAPGSADLLAAVRKLSGGPLKFVINTHWHGDHTGGNERMGQQGAIVVAHNNVRERLNSDQFMAFFKREVPTASAETLPVVTFNDQISLHLNDDRIDVRHVPHAHTDGDAIVHFVKADVLHMGDVFFNRMYPFIDLSSGGSIDGLIAAVETGLKLASAGTQVIPGHGPLTDRAGLQSYAQMLKTLRAAVAKGMASKQTLAQIQASKPAAPFEEKWGGGFISADQLVAFIHQSLSQPRR